MVAPAMAAMRGLHTPHAITTCSASIWPLSVSTAVIRPSSTLDVEDLGVGDDWTAPSAMAFSRMMVPARSESTTDTLGV